ncbi:MAG: hypothetical protein DBX02_04625 [Verrucomicrobia bacterium]|nr:MAG: hypothetical protein CBC36_06225 [Verrucomicrobiaceae bacterium TMED76]RCL30495.1 MAG: hypothetical protein DBX02_04625 [Verrucomicrobiota bacterium]|tara:strand:- start:243 stop:488 length:246 start_codon:yes stop_codon:yes gene_type:complete
MKQSIALRFFINTFLDRLTRTDSELSELVAVGQANHNHYVELKAAHKEALLAESYLSRGEYFEAEQRLENGRRIYDLMKPF